ncbi:MAG TPA: amidohydrolase family protein [Nitrososphaeraceae archaeon]|nr:amidohydrolase family protein [Nitrososphaeraceae archaeon]
MSLVIKNTSILLGKNLTFVRRGYIEIGKDGAINKAGSGDYKGKVSGSCNVLDGEGYLIMPGFVNAHTHIGDSIAKDIAVDTGLYRRVHPVFGAKRKILQRSKPEHLKTFIRSSAISMMKNGIVAFADFREGGTEGINLLKDAIFDLPIKCLVLGRLEYYFDLTIKPKITTRNNKLLKNDQGNKKLIPPKQLQIASSLLEMTDGFGISGANENTNESLQQYNTLLQNSNNKRVNMKKQITAIHAAESKDTKEFSILYTHETEVSRIVRYLKPNLIVHMTKATDDDISMVSKKGIGVIVCPRANGVLGTGIPKIAKMLKFRCIIAIGTDNVMLNSPDIFRELDYIWKTSRSVEEEFISAKDILKMSTVNGAEILGINSGYIGPRQAADIIFIDKNHIDLYPIHDPYASIIHRANRDSIKAVMINGKFVDGVNI